MSILANNKCDSCNVRLPKNRPKLFCKFCSNYKHYRCHRLCKSDAQYIIDLGASYDWMCNECTLDALPVNAAERPKRDPNRAPKVRYTCYSCTGNSYKLSNLRQCPWCDNLCHLKCINASLGCNTCCQEMIP